MKFYVFTCLFVSMSFLITAQTADINARSERLSLSNIEFSIYPNPTDSEFKLEFLLPRKEKMEIYLINTSGDKVKDLLEAQEVEAGIRTFEFEFPARSGSGIYFLVIKSHGKSIIKKIEHKPRA